ncbi:hypothetical protein FIV42_02400 [Persicimonas caeni]|uniref:Uncharacterized protein n=1 Tax=Persicimonas caeni TaxID=2292766 RepID=A0A4Y6PN14_PERCE|nr:hypothetical protein [Persicimonas caeni]QDG49630.1 hypothetical protein FIV42_02400 [Persicimonas caeni]QED30851.1 hypothetical protein FRD00_02395 [Persicimonas caeni]
MSIERFLGVLAADEADSRIELVQVAEPGMVPTLELRFQRHGGDLGWMTHKRMRLAPGQIGDLREAMNLMDPDARDAKISATEKASAHSLRVVGAEDTERSSG